MIGKILEHLGLWGSRRKPVLRGNEPPLQYVAEDGEGYFPIQDEQMVDSIYPVDAYFKVVFYGLPEKFTRESPVFLPWPRISA